VKERKMRKKLLAIILVTIMLLSMVGCGSNNRSEDVAQRQSVEEFTSKGDYGGEYISDPNEDYSKYGEDNEKKEPLLTWYVADDCVAFCYKGEGAKILSEAYEAGRKPRADFSLMGDDYNYSVEWCPYCDRNIQYGYYNGAGNGNLGSDCGGFQAELHCNLALEITGELENGELWICVRHNGPVIDPDSLPGVAVSIIPDYDNNSPEDDFYYQISSDEMSYQASMPARFLEDVKEVSNIVGIDDFPYAQVSYAKTDDYELMRNESSSWLICFNEKGEVVQYVDFWKDLDTGELVAKEMDASIFSDTSKYEEYTLFVGSRHVAMYPNYFSKPWLTLEQFQSMNRD